MGSIYLVNYVLDPFTENARFNFDQFKKDIQIANRMMDNVIELANLPFEKQTKELLRKRRHGIGFLGLGSMFSLLGIEYGSPNSVELTERISYTLAYESLSIGVDLAIEKGPAPIMNEEFTVTAEMKFKKPNIPFNVGDIITGKELLIYSDYLQRFPEELRERIRINGMRYSHATSIAPTGTMALGIGNNTCVAKGSTIKTSEGDVLIENVNIDDHKVLTYIPSKDKFEYREIEFCGLTRPNAIVLEIELEDNTIIKVTPDHKILVKNIKTDKLEYIEAQHINVYENEIVSFEPNNNDCRFCGRIFANRRAMIAHISKAHKIPTLEYQYHYESQQKCSVCHKPMSLDDVKARFAYGTKVTNLACSEECSFDAKIRNERYYMKFHNISYEQARQVFLKKYEDRASLPTQLEYWTRKGYSIDDAKLKVSETQNRVSLQSFISRYGELEGTQKYNEYCETRSDRYSYDGNPRFGHSLSDAEKLKISNAVKQSAKNPDIIQNIVNGKNASDNIKHFPIIGVREPEIWEILNELNVNYSKQFYVVVPLEFKSRISNTHIAYDVLLNDFNCILEINEMHHLYNEHRIIDAVRSDIAKHLGYDFAEIWLTEKDADIKKQIIDIISKFSKVTA